MEQRQRHMMVNAEKTGTHIRELMTAKGYTVRDIQIVMGFSTPQAIYNWLTGKSLPTIDNLVILSQTLGTRMDDILVIDGEMPGKQDDATPEWELRRERIRPPPVASMENKCKRRSDVRWIYRYETEGMSHGGKKKNGDIDATGRDCKGSEGRA